MLGKNNNGKFCVRQVRKEAYNTLKYLQRENLVTKQNIEDTVCAIYRALVADPCNVMNFIAAGNVSINRTNFSFSVWRIFFVLQLWDDARASPLPKHDLGRRYILNLVKDMGSEMLTGENSSHYLVFHAVH